MKHQLLLPKICEVTALLVKKAHIKTLHGGPKLTEAHLRQKLMFV